MKALQQSQMDSLRSVQDFLNANATAVGTLATTAARKQLDAALAALTTLGKEQELADLRLAGHKTVKSAVTSEITSEHMAPIAAFARAKLRGVPEFGTLTRSFRHLRGPKLVRVARAVAEAAAAHADEFTQAGFPSDAVAQLETGVAKLDQALADRKQVKVGRVQATKEIDLHVKLGREAVAMLHATISRQFATDHGFLAGWNNARRVAAKPGVARTPAAPSAPAVSPSTPGGPAGHVAPLALVTSAPAQTSAAPAAPSASAA